MKKIILVTILAVTIILGNSCEKSFIELSPIDSISTDKYYKTQTDIENAVIAVYDAFQALQGTTYDNQLSEVRSDNAIEYFTTVSGGTYADFDNFTVLPSNTVINNYWVKSYNGIQRANVILNRMKDIEIDDASLEGQVKFFRALFYFNLVRYFGGVPLVLDEITDPTVAFNHTRATEGEIYDQIITDLSDAIACLPETLADSEFGRVSKWAAEGILARVQLTLKDYSAAKLLLDDIVISQKYSLLLSFEDVFKYSATGNSEIIFAVLFKSGTNSEGYPYQDINHDFHNSASPNFMHTFADDPRLNATIDTSLVGIYYSPKIVNLIMGSDNTADLNIIILRMADIKLMLAEVLNESGGEIDQILNNLNAVHERAGLVGYTETDLPDKESIRLAIEKERRIEFAFENLRWHDLVRTGKAFEVLSAVNSGGSNTNAGSMLPYTMNTLFLKYPIPQNQIDASAGSLVQTEGY